MLHFKEELARVALKPQRREPFLQGVRRRRRRDKACLECLGACSTPQIAIGDSPIGIARRAVHTSRPKEI